MGKIVRMTESDMVRLIKNVIKEQTGTLDELYRIKLGVIRHSLESSGWTQLKSRPSGDVMTPGQLEWDNAYTLPKGAYGRSTTKPIEGKLVWIKKMQYGAISLYFDKRDKNIVVYNNPKKLKEIRFNIANESEYQNLLQYL
jgi:hypothetical protein